MDSTSSSSIASAFVPLCGRKPLLLPSPSSSSSSIHPLINHGLPLQLPLSMPPSLSLAERKRKASEPSNHHQHHPSHPPHLHPSPFYPSHPLSTLISPFPPHLLAPTALPLIVPPNSLQQQQHPMITSSSLSLSSASSSSISSSSTIAAIHSLNNNITNSTTSSSSSSSTTTTTAALAAAAAAAVAAAVAATATTSSTSSSSLLSTTSSSTTSYFQSQFLKNATPPKKRPIPMEFLYDSLLYSRNSNNNNNQNQNHHPHMKNHHLHYHNNNNNNNRNRFSGESFRQSRQVRLRGGGGGGGVGANGGGGGGGNNNNNNVIGDFNHPPITKSVDTLTVEDFIEAAKSSHCLLRLFYLDDILTTMEDETSCTLRLLDTTENKRVDLFLPNNMIPLFTLEQGWCSWNPKQTHCHLQLACAQLQRGMRCLCIVKPASGAL